jgi:hypothetical protein
LSGNVHPHARAVKHAIAELLQGQDFRDLLLTKLGIATDTELQTAVNAINSTLAAKADLVGGLVPVSELPPVGTGSGFAGVVTNFAALPAANTVSGKFYYVVNAQGAAWLPGALGGTYYPRGTYYSDGTNWYNNVSPFQALQSDVDAGLITDQFVSPATLANRLVLYQQLNPGFKALVNDPPLYFTHFHDLVGWQSSLSSGLINQVALSGRHGILQLTTGASAGGRSCIFRGAQQNTASMCYLGAGVVEMNFLVSFPTLSTSTEEFSAFFGFGVSVASPLVSANICAFKYDRASNGDFWVCLTKRATTGTQTTNVTSVALTAGQFYKLRIVVNAAASQVDFYIDDVQQTPITTNIPAGTSEAGEIFLSMNKSAGTTSRFLNADAYSEKFSLTTPVL